MGLDTTPKTSTMLNVSLMTNFNHNVIKHKLGLFNLAEELNKISRACKPTGFSRDAVYRYKAAKER